MKWIRIFWVVCVAAVFFIGIRIVIVEKNSVTQKVATSAYALSLIVEPDEGVAPVLAMITGAKTSLDIVMYELDDARIEAALAADEARGVTVRVILSGGYKGAPPTLYTAAYNFLAAHGVPVRGSPGYFALTHEKSFVVDGNRALIMTFNWVSKYYATGRDFGIIDSDAHDVSAIEDTFNDDWKGSGSSDSEKASLGGNNSDAGEDLLWSPGSEQPLLDLISSAQKSLYIYNEEMADADITKALIDAARRGVAVYVVMTGSAQWKWQFAELTTAGAHVHTYADEDDAPLYIHAKMIVVDEGSADARAFVGSENFSKGSLDENRELGIITADSQIIARLLKTFTADWRGAAAFAIPK